jgi:hypothetical protein
MLGEDLGIYLELLGKIGPVIAGLFQLPGVPSGKNAGPRRGAFGIGGIGIGKEYPLFSNTVKGRGFDPVTAISSHMRKRCIIGNAKEYVGRSRIRFTVARKHHETSRYQTDGYVFYGTHETIDFRFILKVSFSEVNPK